MVKKRRDNKDNWMPQGVRLAKGRYIIRSKLTNHKEKRLCSGKATRAQVWATYESLQDNGLNTLDDLCKDYLKSTIYKKKSKSTQELYFYCLKALRKITFNGGSKFIELAPEKITSGILRQILDLMDANGKGVMGNRAIKGFLSAVYSWAIERDLIGININPCHAVTRIPEKSDERYVEDQEYYFALKVAEDEFPEFLSRSMELCYLLYNRISETLKLMRSDLLDDGVNVERLKGSKTNIVRWSPRLREAVKSKHKVASVYVLHDDKGQKVSYNRLRYHWDKLMSRCEELAEEKGIVFSRFHRHHLKAKGISDQEKNQNSAGHRDGKSQEVYKRKKDQVDPAK